MAKSDRSMWAVADTVATLLACSAVAARARLLSHASPLIRLMAQRDTLHHETALLERELAVFRSQRQRRASKQRPHYAPEERAEILQVMRLRGWSAKLAGQRFVVHPNTIRNWQRAVDDRLGSQRMLGVPPWNRLRGGVRWLVRELRDAFPEPEFGSRTIARHIMRAGIGISRTTVRRILEEKPTRPPRSYPDQRVTKAPKHVQHPTEPGRVWHLDMTTVRSAWRKVEVAAIVDGYSRRIVALKVFGRRARTDDLADLVSNSVKQSSGGAPRFLVTDHGSQFRGRFRRAVSRLGMTHTPCQVHTWHLNAKVERVFRDLKPWARRAFLVPSTRRIQRQLDAYRGWHNDFRPHAAHGTLTPSEVEERTTLPEPVVYRQRGGVEPRIRLHRRCVRGDPRLAYPVIRVVEHRLEAA
ncbi:MAG: DDE-type integrase/transposase/recombinase [Phycisphaerales bacterium]